MHVLAPLSHHACQTRRELETASYCIFLCLIGGLATKYGDTAESGEEDVAQGYLHCMQHSLACNAVGQRSEYA